MTDMIPRAEAYALVAAAFDVAAKWGDLLCGTENVTQEVAADIRALTPDDARAALEAMLAEARRDGVEAARQAVWDKLHGSQQAEQLCDAIDAAIRAEAETDGEG